MRFPRCLAWATALLLLGGAAAGAASFEGKWSVVIMTDQGSCDAAYRYPLRIENGVVRYEGDPDIKVSGKVDDKGAVQVAISRGAQHAEGSGRLNGDAGSGTWSGASTTDRCEGRWEAERR
ncbi:MAG TPA: hypothetical protein VGH49_14895 [Xanthobacteraceae bacterium]|jgi:hypothetical protein